MATSPLTYVPYNHEILFAIRALFDGKANEGQQLEIARWIVQDVCLGQDLEFHTGVDGDRLSAFAGGRRFCGQQILKMRRPEALAALDKDKADKKRAVESRAAKTPRQPRKSRGK